MIERFKKADMGDMVAKTIQQGESMKRTAGFTADSLVDAVMMDVWPNNATVVDFGIASQKHYEALYYPIRSGEINKNDLRRVVGDGPAITKLVNRCRKNPHRNRLVFKTDYDDMREASISERVASGYFRKAGNEGVVMNSLSKAISAISHLPVEYAFTDARAGREAKMKIKQAIDLMEEVIQSLPVPVSYVVIGVDSRSGREFDSVEELIRYLAGKGIRQIGVSNQRTLRRELQGQPTFDKLIGPMYDGPKRVRYETQAAYDLISN